MKRFDINHRTCSKCGASKPETVEFFRLRGHPCRGGLRPDCRECSKARDIAWGAANREKRRLYRLANADRDRAAKKARDEAYILTDEGRAAHKRAMKKYVSSEKGHLAARMAQHRRRVLKAQGLNDFTSDQWPMILAAFGGVCAYCGSPDRMTHDHVVPLARGGDNTASNIVPACKSCNSSKFSEDMLTWFSRRPDYSDERLRLIVAHME